MHEAAFVDNAGTGGRVDEGEGEAMIASPVGWREWMEQSEDAASHTVQY